jgi:hypothetical protein
MHQQAAIHYHAVHGKNNRLAGKDPVWRRTVELARVVHGESVARVSHAHIESPVRGSAWRRVLTVGAHGTSFLHRIFDFEQQRNLYNSVTYKTTATSI